MLRGLLHFLIGVLKCAAVCAVILLPFFLPEPLLGLMVAWTIFTTPMVLVIIGIAAVWAWARGNITQLIGALCVIPLAYLAFFGFQAYELRRFRMAIDERYLSRVIEHPSGQIDNLLMKASSCTEACAEILVDGLAKRLVLHDSDGRSAPIVMNTYEIARGDKCSSRPGEEASAVTDIAPLQENGVFDACVVRTAQSEVDSLGKGIAEGILIKTDDDHYRNSPESIIRSHGPQNVAVAYKITEGNVGDEYVRWEYAFNRKTKERIGTSFDIPDLVRALTGLPSDRFARALRLSAGEAVNHVYQAVGQIPIDPSAVRRYFEKVRSHRDKSVSWTLDAEHRQRLTEITTSACAVDPKKTTECERQLTDAFDVIFKN